MQSKLQKMLLQPIEFKLQNNSFSHKKQQEPTQSNPKLFGFAIHVLIESGPHKTRFGVTHFKF